MNVIETHNLYKYYGIKKVLDDLNLEVPEGVIFGYLGPNGAGKTTTIRILLNLAKPTKGSVLVLGENISKSRKYLRRIGYLPDVPNFYNYFTAKEYLEVLSEIIGVDKKRVEEVLEIVGLKNEKKRIGAFSRGMKQRLGIAQALLPDPKLLILDEPTSSLDPQGRKEILDLILSLRGEKTVFFSTHILSDVERVCDRVGILREGRLLLNDTLDNIKKKLSRRIVKLKVDDPLRMMERVKKEDFVEEVLIKNQNSLIIKVKDLQRAGKKIPEIIVQENLSIMHFEVSEPTLEDIFFEVIS
ncbi:MULTISPECIES: ABC transporter ATP-binding protein [Dictyoglomus]|uniref:ABC transporter related n=1 Tax=Dictyoglomus turgidum (strain DSM 6724 / Z-1310) TaxID=515635 RepID=B8DYZ1_DICTD|nr:MULTISPECIES: ABC transporter ATP-binding protein [Dictyoglomus]ACK41617.1 ABC transporter related [Dictyoglomus turgidum DSM 6724]HBU32002.1 ABC transporter ATP-binding protein [Dictyoglomus sp.]